jgi:hypothetical protein
VRETDSHFAQTPAGEVGVTRVLPTSRYNARALSPGLGFPRAKQHPNACAPQNSNCSKGLAGYGVIKYGWESFHYGIADFVVVLPSKL